MFEVYTATSSDPVGTVSDNGIMRITGKPDVRLRIHGEPGSPEHSFSIEDSVERQGYLAFMVDKDGLIIPSNSNKYEAVDMDADIKNADWIKNPAEEAKVNKDFE